MGIEVEIIYQEDCPNYTTVCSILCDVIAENQIDASISITKLNPDVKEYFRGSPTVLINGKDVEVCFNEENEVDNVTEVIDTLACRLYNCDIGRGCPSHEMIRCSIQTFVPEQNM